jgi:ribosomal small subunit protein bTHX
MRSERWVSLCSVQPTAQMFRAKLRARKTPTFPEKSKMGRGDKKTRKGKIAKRSYGNARPHKAVVKGGAVKKAATPKPAVKKAAPAAKKAAPKKSV